MNKLWVFDLDDTLIDNVHDYAEPILDACRLIVRVLGNKAPHVSKIIAIEEEIDKRRVQEINPSTGKPYLYSMERFPGTMVEVYKYLCKTASVSPKPGIEEELYAIGLRAFDEERYLRNIEPRAFETLKFLKGQKDTLIILSKGDPRVQQKKINALQEAGIFRQVFFGSYITEDKKDSWFSTIRDNFGSTTSSFWAVGNDYNKDIVPALAVGFKGVWIPVETWEVIGKLEEIEKRIDRSRCRRFESLIEIKEKYEELV